MTRSLTWPVTTWLVFHKRQRRALFSSIDLDGSGRDLRDLHAKICAIGPATADAVRALHLKRPILFARAVSWAEGVLAAFERHDLDGKKGPCCPVPPRPADVLPLETRENAAPKSMFAPAYQNRTTRGPPKLLRRKVFHGDQKPRLDHLHQVPPTATNFATLVPVDRFARCPASLR